MALIYAVCGILLLLLETPYLTLPVSYKTILGIVMISYAAFRIFRLYKNYTGIDEDSENEETN